MQPSRLYDGVGALTIASYNFNHSPCTTFQRWHEAQVLTKAARASRVKAPPKGVLTLTPRLVHTLLSIAKGTLQA